MAKNQPVVVRGIPFEKEEWVPAAVKRRVGDLMTQVYDSLLKLEEVVSLEKYMDEYFEVVGPYRTDVPSVHWYSQLKDVDFAWGDEAFERMSPFWQKPACIPDRNLIVPVMSDRSSVNPVTDPFPYRAIQVAARGGQTRLRRNPFCSDGVVSQFYGTKEAALYHPDHIKDLLKNADTSSFSEFVDVREGELSRLSHQPDYHVEMIAGDMLFIPHGWLYDVIVVEDSISVTWNFVHEKGAREFQQYLMEKSQNR